LSGLLNLPVQDDFVLVLAWLLAALRAQGPYPLLVVSGEQGSAKTIFCKFLKALIDPNIAPVRGLARDERELMIGANNSHLLAFDNLSGLPDWLSDALCRVASGGSLAVRQRQRPDAEIACGGEVSWRFLSWIAAYRELRLLRLDVGCPDHLGPLLGFICDEFAEVRR
jgi:hypothetical protein